jgi:hypothetical protein
MKLEHQPGAGAVEHVRYVCEPSAQKACPRSVFVHFGPVQMKEKLQEVTALTAEKKTPQSLRIYLV